MSKHDDVKCEFANPIKIDYFDMIDSLVLNCKNTHQVYDLIGNILDSAKHNVSSFSKTKLASLLYKWSSNILMYSKSPQIKKAKQ